MSVQRQQQLEDIAQQVLARGLEERRQFLDQVCQGDAALREEVELLISSREKTEMATVRPDGPANLAITSAANDDPNRTVTGAMLPAPLLEPRHDPLLGTTLNNRYLIEKELGRGGFGVVYLARDKQLMSKPVVVKIVRGWINSEPNLERYFRREIEVLVRVNHPGVVSLLDFSQLEDGRSYFVMEYVEGVTLRSILSTDGQQGLALARVANIIQQVGRGLTAAHELEIYHRDLKPENIMVQEFSGGEERVKLIDFGIAKVKNPQFNQDVTTQVAFLGTINYMSPEQLRGENIVAASDIYSLGIIVYEMLTGRKPFNVGSLDQYAAICRLSQWQEEGVKVKPQDLRPEIPDAAQEVLLRALAFKTSERYQRAREFADDLAEALTEKSIQRSVKVVGKASNAPNSKGNKRRPRLWAAVAVSSLLFAGGGGYVYFRQPNAAAVNTSLPVVNSPKSTVATVRRELNYSITVQRTKDGKLYKHQFDPSQELLVRGDKIRLNFFSPQQGHLYLLNETPQQEKTKLWYRLIYPSPLINKGLSSLASEQMVQIPEERWFEIEARENIFIVWSNKEIAVLEDAKELVNAEDRGEIRDSEEVKVIEELLHRYGQQKPSTELVQNRKATRLQTDSEVLVYQLKLDQE
jgi:serine/threonine protein kinase